MRFNTQFSGILVASVRIQSWQKYTMGLLDFFSTNKLPPGFIGSSIVICDLSTFKWASAFLDALHTRFQNLSVAFTDQMPDKCIYPSLLLSGTPKDATAQLIKTRAERIIVLGLSANFASIIPTSACPCYWINARDAAISHIGCQVVTTALYLDTLPNAKVTGDPLADIERIPSVHVDTAMCKRFKEQREGKRWLAYFSATGESEESIAYGLFNRAIRHKMGMMLLAPHDIERCEPVYRESIKYRLQTIRHNRFSTSFIPLQTRVYYIEGPEPLTAMYACADFVIAGGTLHEDAQHAPDIITPILYGKPVLVGAAQRQNSLLAAAIASDVVRHAENEEQLFSFLRELIDDPQSGAALAHRASEWLTRQPGSTARVMALID